MTKEQLIKELTDLYDVLSVGFEESEDDCELFPVYRTECEAVGCVLEMLKGGKL